MQNLKPNLNFSAGPAMLPAPVLEQIQKELTNWYHHFSVMELGHRIPQVVEMALNVGAELRSLLEIPETYEILFMQGGARTQFDVVPLNLLGDKDTADYMVTGHWSKLATRDAKKSCKINLAIDTESINYLEIPPESEWKLNSEAAFVHCTDNETIQGVEFPTLPDTKGVPLVVDATSSLLGKPLDFTNLGVVYASAQKNLGIAGITVVIVRKDLLGKAHPLTPTTLNYAKVAEAKSMMNTPAVFPWYVTGLVLKWVKEQGGVAPFVKLAATRSNMLYEVIDSDDFYRNQVKVEYRSQFNVPFNLPSTDLEAQFLAEAEEQGLYYLKGHRVTGGIRASMYNAMPLEGAERLRDFMLAFREKNKGK